MADATLNWYSTAIEALRGANLTGKTALVTGGDWPALVHPRAARCVYVAACVYVSKFASQTHALLEHRHDISQLPQQYTDTGTESWKESKSQSA